MYCNKKYFAGTKFPLWDFADLFPYRVMGDQQGINTPGKDGGY